MVRVRIRKVVESDKNIKNNDTIINIFDLKIKINSGQFLLSVV
jgi:hypothetical protein